MSELRTSLTNPMSGAAAIADDDFVIKSQVSSSLNGGTPNLTAGASAGTTPTLVMIPHAVDGAFAVSLDTGTSCATADTIFTVTLSTAAAHYYMVTFSPMNANAATLSGAKSVYVALPAGAVFDFKAGATALTDATQYLWMFHTRPI